MSDDDYDDSLPISQKAEFVWHQIQILLTYGISYRAGVIAHREGAAEIGPQHILVALEENFQKMVADLKENGDIQAQLDWLDELGEP